MLTLGFSEISLPQTYAVTIGQTRRRRHDVSRRYIAR